LKKQITQTGAQDVCHSTSFLLKKTSKLKDIRKLTNIYCVSISSISQIHTHTLLTFVPRNVTRGRRAATTIPFSLTVTATFLSVPPFPHFGQKILPISAVTVKQA